MDNKKYYSASEIKEMAVKEHKLPKAKNEKGIKFSFIVKPRDYIYADSGSVSDKVILK